jgi:hypothetical protein
MFTERRKAVRIGKHIVVQYQEFGNPEHWDITEIKNFSEVGMLITTEKSCEPNTMLRFRIKLPSNPFKSYELEGKVVTCGKNVTGAYPDSKVASHLVRIEIVKISSEAKEMIRSYITWFLNKGGGTT